MFYIGQRVVYVRGDMDARHRRCFPSLPTLNGIYTIRELEMGKRGLGVRLVEIVNPPIDVINLASGLIWTMEPTLLASRFRPATDISAFTAMLAPKRSKAVV